jgi:hypothetical protein
MMAGRRLALKTVLAINIKLRKVWLPKSSFWEKGFFRLFFSGPRLAWSSLFEKCDSVNLPEKLITKIALCLPVQLKTVGACVCKNSHVVPVGAREAVLCRRLLAVIE